MEPVGAVMIILYLIVAAFAGLFAANCVLQWMIRR